MLLNLICFNGLSSKVETTQKKPPGKTSREAFNIFKSSLKQLIF